MPNAQSLAAIAQLHLVVTVDTARIPGDPFKLPGALCVQADADLAGLETADSNTVLTESDRAGGSKVARASLDKLQNYLKEGFNFITAIRASQNTPAARLETFTAYGWAGGKMGRLNDARVIGLARLAIVPHPEVADAFRYPGDLVDDITNELMTFDGSAAATKARDAKLELANSTLAQIRFFYCSASRDTDQTPELAKIGFQPRREPGTVNHHKNTAPTTTAPTSGDKK